MDFSAVHSWCDVVIPPIKETQPMSIFDTIKTAVSLMLIARSFRHAGLHFFEQSNTAMQNRRNKPPFSRNKRNKKFLQNIPAPSVSKKLKPGTPCKSRDSGLFACLLSTVCVQNAVSVSITGRHYPFTAPAITPEMMNFWQARYRTMIGMIASTSMAIIAPMSTEP